MRFTIRDLLWLMVVVGTACGWVLNDRAWRRYRDYRVAFAEKESKRLLFANVELDREIQSLLLQYGEAEKLQDRRRKARIGGESEVDRNIIVQPLVP